jgi:stage II sporulation protein D
MSSRSSCCRPRRFLALQPSACDGCRMFGKTRGIFALVSVAALGGGLCASAFADETSATDKLRILYANRFTFTDDKLPLITVEIATGIKTATISAKSGVVVRPDGQGGSAVQSEGDGPWIVRAENSQPALILDWTVVDTLGPDDSNGIASSMATWKARGFEPKAFDIGSVFGVDGEVIDSRETRIAIDPVARGQGAARAAQVAKKFSIATSVHQELVRRPSGTIVAERNGTVVRNPSVIWFSPLRSEQTLQIADVPVGGGGSQLTTTKEDRRYWGSMYVTLSNDGALVVVNAVPEDKLLAGIVPSEMFPDAPDAALQAQAIAARTELLQKIGRRNLTDPFLLCSTQQCQVYSGAGKEDPRTTRAVEKTRGVVLLRDGGGMVDVRYSASCGGHSEDNDSIWQGQPDPSLRGRPDRAGKDGMSRVTADNLEKFLDQPPEQSWCGQTKLGKGRFRWTAKISADDLSTRVAEEFPSVGRVTAIVPGTRGVSGRISTLTIRGDRGTAEVTGDLKIRRLLGGLKSSLFAVDVEGAIAKPTSFVFRGAGFGHGVGMCQMGAIGMAEAGKNYQQILQQYYRGTHIKKLY